MGAEGEGLEDLAPPLLRHNTRESTGGPPSAPPMDNNGRMEFPPTYEEAVNVRDGVTLPPNPPPYSPTV